MMNFSKRLEFYGLLRERYTVSNFIMWYVGVLASGFFISYASPVVAQVVKYYHYREKIKRNAQAGKSFIIFITNNITRDSMMDSEKMYTGHSRVHYGFSAFRVYSFILRVGVQRIVVYCNSIKPNQVEQFFSRPMVPSRICYFIRRECIVDK